MKTVFKDVGEIIENFINRIPCKSPYLKPGQAGFCAYRDRGGIRDRVIVEGNTAKYLLWGNCIAEWDGKILKLDNCGWETALTVDRMQYIYYGCFKSLHSEDNSSWWDTLLRRPKLPHLGRYGYWFYTAAQWNRTFHDYPLIADVKNLRLLSKISTDAFVDKLLRARKPEVIMAYKILLGNLNVNLSLDIKARISAKIFRVALDNSINQAA